MRRKHIEWAKRVSRKGKKTGMVMSLFDHLGASWWRGDNQTCHKFDLCVTAMRWWLAIYHLNVLTTTTVMFNPDCISLVSRNVNLQYYFG